MKKKVKHNSKLSEQKKIFRIPVSKPTSWHRDKSKYSRTVKHPQSY